MRYHIHYIVVMCNQRMHRSRYFLLNRLTERVAVIEICNRISPVFTDLMIYILAHLFNLCKNICFATIIFPQLHNVGAVILMLLIRFLQNLKHVAVGNLIVIRINYASTISQ